MAKYSQLCVDFNGTTKFADTGNVLDKTDASLFSICAWVRAASPSGDIISKMDGSDFGYAMRISAQDLVFTLGDTGGGIAEVRSFYNLHSTNITRWVFYVVTYDGGSDVSGMLLYADGLPMRKTNGSNTLAATISSLGRLTIAGRNGSADFGASAVGNGVIDNVAIYDGVLSPAEILLLFNNREPVDYSLVTTGATLESHWRMGDGDTHPTLTDNVGSNDLTLTGTTSADILNYHTAGGWPVNVVSLGAAGNVTTFHMGGLDSGDNPLSWIETGAPGTGNAPGGLIGGTDFIQSSFISSA